jgi:phosphopantothenoylcysteine decarboxylase/phosphopantothenate--cysteine ligase
VGRLAEPSTILAAVERALAPGAGSPAAATPKPPRGGRLDGLRVLVTAGGTREPIDSVRYVGNRSSGRMGVALTAEAARRGADVTLIGANLAVDPPAGVETVPVATAAELEAAARDRFPDCDVLLMAAAVADFRPADAADDKLKKAGRERLALDLEPTTDVLAALAARRRDGQTLVGFAAEHGADGIAEARAKLERKGLDAVVLNDISRPEIGFDADRNEVTIVTRDEQWAVPLAAKDAVASAILDRVESWRAAKEVTA